MAQNGGEINRKSEKVRRANRIIQNRTMILMAVLGVLVFLILVIKLFSLQILRHDELEAKALDQQTRSTVVTATHSTKKMLKYRLSMATVVASLPQCLLAVAPATSSIHSNSRPPNKRPKPLISG